MNDLTKQSQSSIRDNNLRLILDTIIRDEPLSRADIVRATRMSKPTVSSLTDELIGRGIVSEAGIGPSHGGRKPVILRFNSRMKHLIAFEMGRVGYRVAVADLKGGILKKMDGEYRPLMGLNERLETTKDLILDALQELDIGLREVLKIICIAPGVYVERGEELKWYPVTDRGSMPDIRGYFQEHFHHDVIFDHSTKLSLLGENIEGKARGYRNVLYIDFAYGLGCSFMINGRVYFGSNNSAGEIGYFYSSPEEFRCRSITPYELGALEQHLSGYALRRKGMEAAERHPESLISNLAGNDESRVTAKSVFDAALQNDQVATSILRDSFGYFNMALCNVINLLTPELVILGGGFSNAGKQLLSLIQDEIRDRVLVMPELKISDLKNDASIIGGVQYLIQCTDLLDEL
jgi:N-acetylglucosamine repressor